MLEPDSPQTLVFIQKTAGRGGAKNRLLDTLSTLRRGTDCRLHVVTSETGEFTERCADLGVPVTVHPLPEWRKLTERLRFPGALNSLKAKLPFTQADWVVSNEMWWAPHAAALARKLGGRSAAILRDGIADAHKGRKYRLQKNDLILPSSLKIARGLQSDAELAARTHVFLDAVFLPSAVAGTQEWLAEKTSPVNPDVKRWLLVVGKVQARKRQADAVRVLHGLIEKGHGDLGLLVAGDCEPDYEPEMASAIHECGMRDRVVMLGNVSDVRTLYSCASICLLTSLREALPGSVMESLLCDRPCFMYPCEGAEDIFGPHQAGFVSGSFEPGPLVEKMDALLRQPELLASETTALRNRAESLFSYEAHLRALRDRLGVDLKANTRTEPI